MVNPVREFKQWLGKELEKIQHRFETDVIYFKYPALHFYNALLRVRATILGKPIVHVIGDSHIKSYIFEDPFFIHHIDQATAYNLDKQKSTTRSKAKFEKIIGGINQERDILLMVFGEIDARIHIYYQYEKNRRQLEIKELIDRTIHKYGEILGRLVNAGYTVAVHGIPPATSIKINHFQYPYYGTPQQRSEISREFNTKLRAYCSRNNMLYIDVYSATVNRQGFIKKGFAEDDIHLNKKIVPFTKQQLAIYFGARKRFLAANVDKPEN
jgi:hypothetical protein